MKKSAKSRENQLETAYALLARGRRDEARLEADRILARAPEFPEAWHVRGLCLYAAGNRAGALEALEKAAAFTSAQTKIVVDCITLLCELGQTAGALELVERKMASQQGQEAFLIARAETLCRLNRGPEAIADLRALIGKRPHDADLRLLLAECLEQGADFDQALETLDAALKIAPSMTSPLHRHRARILLHEQRIAEAERELELAVAASGENSREERARTHLALADVAALKGDFTQASELARSAVRLDPGLYVAWLHIVPGRRKPVDNALVHNLAGLCQAKAQDPYAWPIFVASGRALEAAGQYDAAFRLYTAANLKRSYLTPYDPEARKQLTADIIQRLDKTFVSRRPVSATKQVSLPIFIIGLPRSGTTLLESILATHTDVKAGGEMGFLYDWLTRRFGNYSSNATGTLLSELPDEEMQALASEWTATVNKVGNGARWLTDKLPDNFLFAGLCHMCFPDAPIIWMRRDPRDIAISCYTTPFMSGQEHSNRLEWLGQYQRLHERLMEHWQTVLPAKRIIPVEYEDLVRHPEATTQSLFAEIGITWDSSCLDFHHQQRPIATASLQQVREPLNDRSIGRWRLFERHLGPLISALSDPRDPLRPNVQE